MMTKLKQFISVLNLLTVLICAQSPVAADFFSRTIEFASDGGSVDDKPSQIKQPTGVNAAKGSAAQVGGIIAIDDGVLYTSLGNNRRIPLVGVGVGNARHEFVGAIVSEAIQDERKIRLIDTAHASHNEHLVSEGLIHGVEAMKPDHKIEIHVVTKVWYTYLGYERTKASVLESIQSFAKAIEHEKINLRIHVLLHWPRCYESVPWMECVKEETNLPSSIKDLGPDPNLDSENAWKESWKALEDLYLSDKFPIESIGISNFHVHDIEAMDSFARIHPHVLQVNLWSLLYDAMLVDYCHNSRIHIQAYNAMNGTLFRPDEAPRAYKHILKTATELEKIKGTPVTPGQVILAWLIQHGVSVVPRTSRLQRLQENSALSLAAIPALTDKQVETVAHSVEAYLSGDDLMQDLYVSVSFHVVSKDIMLYWRDSSGEEVRVAHVRQGESFHEETYPFHVFRTYDASNKDYYVDHEIDANFGEHKDIHVEL